MSASEANHTWLIETGGEVVVKVAEVGLTACSTWERLVRWFWWADYMMCNAGGFANAENDDRDFQVEIVKAARALNLRYTAATFSLPREQLQAEWFERFDRVCDEVRACPLRELMQARRS